MFEKIVPKIAPFLSGIAQVMRVCWFGVSRETLTRRSSSLPNHPETRKVTWNANRAAANKIRPPSWVTVLFYIWCFSSHKLGINSLSHFIALKWFILFVFLVFGAFFLALSRLPTMLCGSRCNQCVRVSGGSGRDGHSVGSGQQTAGQVPDPGGDRWVLHSGRNPFNRQDENYK